MDALPRVKPIDVPWQVCAATPFLRLEIADDPQKARVTFAAHYGPLSPSTGAPSLASGIAGGFSEVMMVAAPSKFRLHKGGNEPVYGYHRVRVEFEASITAHFTEIVPEAFSPYDWSGGSLNLEELGVDRYVERFRELWSETSALPQPPHVRGARRARGPGLPPVADPGRRVPGRGRGHGLEVGARPTAEGMVRAN